MKWVNLFLHEAIFVTIALFALGYIKLPKFFRQRKLARGCPWGYYPDKALKADPGFFSEDDKDFLHNQGTAFTGVKGFGDYGGNMTGFGEFGEF
jgi:xanthine dehydrogenase molybdopterin-binding subunit B